MATDWPSLAIAIPTFRRNESLSEVLASIDAQAIRPGLVLVVDNNPADDAASAVEAFAARSPLSTRYLPLHMNTGPAGAFAVAVDELAANHPSIRWMLCRGDDNPLSSGVLTELKAIETAAVEHGAAAFGSFGKRKGLRLNEDRHGVVEVDYLTGGGCPVYDVSALSRAGINFHRSLFFGYEELHLGHQIRAKGLTIIAGRLVDEEYIIAPKRKVPWRAYFYHRNRLLVARQFNQSRVNYFIATSLYGAVRHLFAERSLEYPKATLLGMIDGLRPHGRRPRRSYIPV